jgi:hypothetical protein
MIPAYNEAATIYDVAMKAMHNCSEWDIVVINDGSKDNTREEALRTGVKVLDLPFNLGIGGSVQTGYHYALQQGYDYAVQLDGDGQHDPKDLSKLTQALQRADLVIGSRFKEQTAYRGNVFRRLGSMYFSTLVSRLCGKNYYDTTSGFRAVNRRCMVLFSHYYPNDYPEVVTLMLAVRNGLRVEEVRVEMQPRQGGQSSITPLKSLYYMLKVTAALLAHGMFRRDSL